MVDVVNQMTLSIVRGPVWTRGKTRGAEPVGFPITV